MKQKFATHRKLKLVILNLLLFFFSLLFATQAISQLLDETTKARLEVVTNYLVATDDNTDIYLERLRYQRPTSISAIEWKTFPSIRKIQMAYKAAAVNQQGDDFIAALSKLVAQEYKSIKSEHILSRHFSNSNIPSIKFSNPAQLSAFDKIPVPASIKAEIFTVGKYVNEGALGSLQSVMKNYFNLDDAIIYDLLSRSTSNHEAFEQGLLKSKVPPPHETKLAHMADDLQNHYKGLQKDARLSEVAKRNQKSSYSFLDDQIKPDDFPSAPTPGPNSPSGSGSGGGMNFNEFKEKYKGSYTKHTHYEHVYKNRSKSFKNMVRFKGGHGGVILGDSIRLDPKLKPIELRWRPFNDTVQQDYKKIGYLEIRFANMPGYKLFGPVLYEDVFASYAVVNDSRYKYGNGIGMVSIIDSSNVNFSDGSKRFGITLHPAVSHLRLGWAFVIVDALAVARNSFEKAISGSNASELLEQFYLENNSTWKVTDKKIRIKIEGGHIIMEPVILTMWGFRNSEDTPIRSSNFEKLLPIICSSVEEFKRVNEFAKVLSLFRWAKLMNSKVSNISTYNSFIPQPVCAYVNNDRDLKFLTRQEDEERIQSEKKLFITILDSSRNDQDAHYARKIDSLQNWVKSISNSREKYWSMPTNTSPEKALADLKREDTTGLLIIREINRIYSPKWMTKSVQLVNPDSVQYYQLLSERVTRDLQPIINCQNKIDSLSNLAITVMDKYHYNPSNPMTILPPQVKSTLTNIFSKLREARLDYELTLIDPKWKAVKTDLFSLRSFEVRNNVVTSSDFYRLMQSEKKAITDYFE